MPEPAASGKLRDNEGKMTDDIPTDGGNTPEPPKAEGEQKQQRVIKIGTQRAGHEVKPAESPTAPTLQDSLAVDAASIPARPLTDQTLTDPPLDDQPTVEQFPEQLLAEATAAQPRTANAALEPAPSNIDTALTDSSFPPPRMKRLSEDVQREVDEALAGLSIDELLGTGKNAADDAPEIELDSRYTATVVRVDREYIFFALPGHNEGVAAIKHFEQLPEVGTKIEVIATGFKPDERMYELNIPGAAVDVGDWSDINEGVVVEVTVTGHNTGGLECKVGGIRGFIPISQIALYHVDDCAAFVDEKLRCVVTEANPSRGNLVLSHRAFLEREREAAREELFSKLAVGQEHEGVVRKIMDFGAFVDIGGVDGLVHVSKLSWDRVKHPSDVLTEGEKVRVKIEKIDPETGKLSFSYRDLLDQPWDGAGDKYPVNAIISGTVSKIMPFGAFVRLGPGVEGLVHISEVAHHRVTRVDNVVREGDEVSVKVLSVDEANQKMSLSIKGAQAATPVIEANEDDEDSTPALPLPKSNKPLQGGLNKPTGGENIGLNW